MKYILSSIILLLGIAQGYSQCNGTIEGNILIQGEDTAQGHTVSLISDISDDESIVITVDADSDGHFSIPLDALTGDVTEFRIEVEGIATSPLNGVSTLDIVLMMRHILGIQPFENSLQLILGDVNCDGVISAIDLVMTRTVILGVANNFQRGDFCYIPSSGSLSEIKIENCVIQGIEQPIQLLAYKKGNVSNN